MVSPVPASVRIQDAETSLLGSRSATTAWPFSPDRNRARHMDTPGPGCRRPESWIRAETAAILDRPVTLVSTLNPPVPVS